VCNAVGLLILLKLCPVRLYLSLAADDKNLWVIYFFMSAPDDPCICDKNFFVWHKNFFVLQCVCVESDARNWLSFTCSYPYSVALNVPKNLPLLFYVTMNIYLCVYLNIAHDVFTGLLLFVDLYHFNYTFTHALIMIGTHTQVLMQRGGGDD